MACCKFLLMTGKTTGSGACEGESTCDGEVFLPLPRVTLIASAWLEMEQCILVQGWSAWTETTNKLEQLLSSPSFFAYCHGGWFRAVGPSWHLEAQASYTRARAESKGPASSFPCNTLFLFPLLPRFLAVLGDTRHGWPAGKQSGQWTRPWNPLGMALALTGFEPVPWRWMSLWVLR